MFTVTMSRSSSKGFRPIMWWTLPVENGTINKSAESYFKPIHIPIRFPISKWECANGKLFKFLIRFVSYTVRLCNKTVLYIKIEKHNYTSAHSQILIKKFRISSVATAQSTNLIFHIFWVYLVCYFQMIYIKEQCGKIYNL